MAPPLNLLDSFAGGGVVVGAGVGVGEHISGTCN